MYDIYREINGACVHPSGEHTRHDHKPQVANTAGNYVSGVRLFSDGELAAIFAAGPEVKRLCS